MSAGMTKPPWEEPGWMDSVRSWITANLHKLRMPMVGPIEQPHVRPWSTVLRVPTENGPVFFKACASGARHEPAVTAALARWQPDVIPMILAIEPAQGWMLMADGGRVLRESVKADGTTRHWEILLPLFGQLQIDLTSRVEELLGLGLPDRRLAILPDLIEELLDDTEILLINQPEGLTSSEHKRLLGMKPRLVAICDQLAEFPIPESIHHGDLHDANVFFDGDRYVFFDWGDASIAHPFFSLRVAFVVAEWILGIEEGAREFDRLRDAYLEPWGEFAGRKDLLAALDLATCLSPLCAALRWHGYVSILDVSDRADYAGHVPGLLQDFLTLADAAKA